MPYRIDHRQLADEMEIYFFDEQIGAGLPVWLPNGVAIRDALEAFVKKLELRAGFHRVVSPHVARAELYARSGHLRAFAENMYPPMQWPEEKSEYYLKPMNCPHHHKVFANQLRSYRQLPFRVAEYGQVYRHENSGSLRGLSRVRGLCQNDAHIYLDPIDAAAEIENVLLMHEQCYRAIGLNSYRYRLSKHDPQRMENFDGDSDVWFQGEEILRACLQKLNLNYFEAVGEAAFYGPKIDVQMFMGVGDDNGPKEESIASVQLDFNSGEKFDLRFVSASGEKKVPWIIHRAPLGSHERFVALLLEFFDGQLPGWLSPVQVCILPVDESHACAAHELASELREIGVRVQIDNNVGSLSKRVLFAHRLRPYVKIILGSREIDSGQWQFECKGQKHSALRSELVSRLQILMVEPEVIQNL